MEVVASLVRGLRRGCGVDRNYGADGEYSIGRWGHWARAQRWREELGAFVGGIQRRARLLLNGRHDVFFGAAILLIGGFIVGVVGLFSHGEMAEELREDLTVGRS
jgi:hypothetical protein